MNKIIAARMLAILNEDIFPQDQNDDAFYIIKRLLESELRKAGKENQDFADFSHPNRDECLLWLAGNKVQAIKKYRERVGCGLYECKQRMDAVGDQMSAINYNNSKQPEEIYASLVALERMRNPVENDRIPEYSVGATAVTSCS